MPNPEQYKISQHGAETWNAWREQNPDVRPDLSGADLRGFNLFEANLRETNLAGADLSGADLREAEMAGADLTGVTLAGANLIKARLQHANLAGLSFAGVRVRGISFEGANLAGVDLQDAVLTGANFAGADLSGANLAGADLSGANLSGTELAGCRLQETRYHFTFFTPEALDNARMGGALFKVVNEVPLADGSIRAVATSLSPRKRPSVPPPKPPAATAEPARPAPPPVPGLKTKDLPLLQRLKVLTRKLFAVLALSLLCLPAPAHAQNGSGPHQPEIPRLETDVQIDGMLDESAWAEAASFGAFSQYQPVDGRPAQDSTEVLVWYTPTAIYFGLRCYARGNVRATLADRDKISGDDYIQILLDTFNDQRQAFIIAVNPLGVQADGILRDAVSSGSSLRGGGSTGYTVDLSPDFVFQSKGRLTPDGYEVEIEVPFKSLRYQNSYQQDWGFNVIRKVQYSGHENTLMPVRQANASFLSQSGTLQGLTDLRRGLVLDVNPEVTSSINGAPSDPDGGWHYGGGTPEFGGNLRWGLTNNLTLNASANPDFSQVEADVAQVQYDPRRALFFPEKRPFFLDGIELFQMPQQLIYTRSVVDPTAAVKLAGKVSNTNVAMLSAVDARATSLTADNYRAFNLLRVNQDLGGQSTLGVAYTDKIDGDHYNRVGAIDGRFVFGGLYTAIFQGALSTTGGDRERITAPMWYLRVSRAGRRYGFTSLLDATHPDFRAESGFFSRIGTVHANFIPRITLFGKPGNLLESWTGSVTFDGIWDYDRFTSGKVYNDGKLHFSSNFQLRGGWGLGASFLFETFKYPADLYTDYFIELQDDNGVPVDTVAYTGTDRLSNYDLVLNVSTPSFQKFSGSLFVIAGRDENFFEWAPANILFITLTAAWRPTEQIRVDLRYTHQQYIRYDDWSNAGIRRVPRLKVEYQLTRAIFIRFVGQYDANFVDELRDNFRTDDPILIYDAGTGTYERTRQRRRNDFRVDWLFSYRPVPGTVFFFGYGSSLDEPDSFRFRRLDRLNDGFFMKLSYLFRV